MCEIYEPIKRMIDAWIWYSENVPKSNYDDAPEDHDNFRKEHDLDCILTGGNLFADTIFSLWLPLRFTIVNINSYQKIERICGCKVDKNVPFLSAVADNIDELLPKDNELVINLSKLFDLGQTRANVMILPDRRLNKSRWEKTFDYMPNFLYKCFKGKEGEFSSFFHNDDTKLINWIEREHLTFFFENEEIKKDNLLDLAGTNDKTNNVPPNINALNEMLISYIQILEKRGKYYV